VTAAPARWPLLRRIGHWLRDTRAPAPPAPPADAGDNDNLPDAAGQAPAPPASALHLFLDDGLLHVDGDRLALATRDGGVTHLRFAEIGSLSLHGLAGATSPAIRALAAAGVPLLWRDAAGRVAVLGQPPRADSAVRRAQYAALADPPARLAVARELVRAKLRSTRGLLRRRGVSAVALARLADLTDSAAAADSLPALMGVEGAGAALAFAEWPRLISPDAGFSFAGRERRPARDPVNAMLNYACAIVAGEARAAATVAGLDPFAGFLHAERAGRPALALDLMEPLRPLVAERAVLRVVNRREVRPEDIPPAGPEGIRLPLPARKALVAAVETRFAEAAPGGGAWRQALFADAAGLAAALRSGEPFRSRLVAP
jgi:CRISPR-associated endonuclease Cas1